MSDSDSLYQDAIKQFARDARGHGQLENATGEARLDNPLCGDRVRMQVALDAGRIAAIAHETRGCLLCRAAAAVIGSRAVGQDQAGIEAVVEALEGMLRNGTPAPSAWPELAMFEPARAYPSRYRCVLLPFQALLAALRNPAVPHQKLGACDTAISSGRSPP
jgi:SUF system NifU family Fe-S assembly protein